MEITTALNIGKLLGFTGKQAYKVGSGKLRRAGVRTQAVRIIPASPGLRMKLTRLKSKSR